MVHSWVHLGRVNHTQFELLIYSRTELNDNELKIKYSARAGNVGFRSKHVSGRRRHDGFDCVPTVKRTENVNNYVAKSVKLGILLRSI